MPKIIVSFSGGKDSTWMLLEMIRRKEHIDEVVFFDGGWEFPQTLRHVDKIKKIVESQGITFTTIHPPKDFTYIALDIPTPSRPESTGWSWCGYANRRWGTKIKMEVINKYFKGEVDHIQCVGIAADEVNRIKPEYLKTKRYPLVEWGITEAECLAGCYSLGYDWEGLYELLDRVSCKFCPFKNLKELRNIYWKMPYVWGELREFQKRTHLPYKGKGKSVFDLEVRFELEKEFEEQNKSIRSREFYNELKARLA